MARRVRVAREQVIGIPNADLFPPEARAEAARQGVNFDDVLKRTKAWFKSTAETMFKSGAAGIPYRTGRLRRSLMWHPVASGVSITSDLVYGFQASLALTSWWVSIGYQRFTKVLYGNIGDAAAKLRNPELGKGTVRDDEESIEREVSLAEQRRAAEINRIVERFDRRHDNLMKQAPLYRQAGFRTHQSALKQLGTQDYGTLVRQMASWRDSGVTFRDSLHIAQVTRRGGYVRTNAPGGVGGRTDAQAWSDEWSRKGAQEFKRDFAKLREQELGTFVAESHNWSKKKGYLDVTDLNDWHKAAGLDKADIAKAKKAAKDNPGFAYAKAWEDALEDPNASLFRIINADVKDLTTPSRRTATSRADLDLVSRLMSPLESDNYGAKIREVDLPKFSDFNAIKRGANITLPKPSSFTDSLGHAYLTGGQGQAKKPVIFMMKPEKGVKGIVYNDFEMETVIEQGTRMAIDKVVDMPVGEYNSVRVAVGRLVPPK